MAKVHSEGEHGTAAWAAETIEDSLVNHPTERDVERRFRKGHAGATLFKPHTGGNPPVLSNPLSFLLGR